MAGFALLHGAWHGPSCWELVAEELQQNGLLLETVTISRLDQTDPHGLSDENIFDAQGKKKITEILQTAFKDMKGFHDQRVENRKAMEAAMQATVKELALSAAIQAAVVESALSVLKPATTDAGASRMQVTVCLVRNALSDSWAWCGAYGAGCSFFGAAWWECMGLSCVTRIVALTIENMRLWRMNYLNMLLIIEFHTLMYHSFFIEA